MFLKEEDGFEDAGVTSMKIVLLEAFFSGSHRQWAEGLQRFSKHEIEILSLPGRHWKWRMHGGAITLAKRFQQLQTKPDLIIATDMLDLGQFLSLTRKETAQIPVAIYFHENQLSYPWSPTDEDVELKRDRHYGWLNYTSALAADTLFF
ncbi:MAG: tRNA-queuosine alpha-mannosyltransferase domain-containing protein, partial [Cyclobacteriaceae bacterium]